MQAPQPSVLGGLRAEGGRGKDSPGSCSFQGARNGGPEGAPRLIETCYLLSDTLIASAPPLWFVRDSYVTLTSNGSLVMSPTMLLWCTKRFSPLLWTIQPYPLSASKVLMVPFFKRKTPPRT